VTEPAVPAPGAPAEVMSIVEEIFEREALPVLEQYTRIPCLSPDFDSDWAAHGHIPEAAELLRSWAAARPIAGLEVELLELPGLTPVIVAEVPSSLDPPATADPAGTADQPVHDRGLTRGLGTPDAPLTLLYGHLDKQPPLGTWRDDLDPFRPVRDGDRLYGRGTADDGYSIFAALGAVQAAAQAGRGHGRCLVLIEASEESGSPHLPAYLEALSDRLGSSGPALVVCLDSGCLTYDRLWTTTSLRGLVSAEIRVDVLTEGVHSGSAGGVVPSSFRILRQLLSRIEDETTGEVLLSECNVRVPDGRLAEAEELVSSLGDGALDSFPVVPGLRVGAPGHRWATEHRSGVDGAGQDQKAGRADLVKAVLERTWGPSLAFVGIDGVPSMQDGGNVLRPFTAGRIAMRVPPSADAGKAAAQLIEVLSADPPDGATVTVKATGESGFDAPKTAGWLADATRQASLAYFAEPAAALGEGGTIPFLSQLQKRYPAAQFLVTGVLGPESNAHGPNEMLHVPTAKRVTASVAHVLSQVR
jgi:acetylornithine deacetylase/succinyl-diaminopimelate desuccinylase-like protein